MPVPPQLYSGVRLATNSLYMRAQWEFLNCRLRNYILFALTTSPSGTASDFQIVQGHQKPAPTSPPQTRMIDAQRAFYALLRMSPPSSRTDPTSSREMKQPHEHDPLREGVSALFKFLMFDIPWWPTASRRPDVFVQSLR